MRKMRKPDFVIIGAMKAGTSSLHSFLSEINGIYMTEMKEPNFFSNDEFYEKGADWYFSLFDKAAQSDICGESSTHYTKMPTYPKTVDRMKKVLPNVKLIYIMRNPIERLISQYIHEWTANQTSEDLENSIFNNPDWVNYSCYNYQIDCFIQKYSAEQILPVFMERLLKNSTMEINRILNFLSIDKGSGVDYSFPKDNQSSERIKKNLLMSFKDIQPFSYLKKLLPKSLKEEYKKRYRINNRPLFSVNYKKKLRKIFDDDLYLLGKKMKVSLNCDNYESIILSNRELEWKN